MPSTVCYRIAGYREALWKLPNLQPGRFHELGDPPTQYLTLHPLTAWAEIVRSSRLPRSAIRTEDFVLRIWALRVDLELLTELGFDNCQTYGISAAELVDDDQSFCRAVGQQLRQRMSGIVYPSSALPGTPCVCLFGERFDSPYLEEPIDQLDVPTSVAAETGRPLQSLLPAVCLRGEPHAALNAYLAGDSFAFDEPGFGLPSGS